MALAAAAALIAMGICKLLLSGATAATLCLAADVRAAPAPSYPQLLAETRDRAPALLAGAAELRAARGDARQAHALPNPSVGVEVENVGVARAADGSTDRQSTFSVTEPIELGGKRSARIAVGESKLVAAEARDRQTRMTYAGALATAYAEAEAATLKRQLAADELARAQEDLRAAVALVKAGKEADLRSAQARASVAAANADLEQEGANAAAALEALSVLAGAAQSYEAVTPYFLRDQRTGPAAGPDQGMSPAAAIAVAERDASAASLRLERARPVPDIGLSVGARRYQGNGDTGLVLGVSATIPLFNRNRGGIDAAKARLAASEARLRDTELRVAAARRTALTQIRAADARLAAAGDGEAAAGEAYRLARIGYDAGKTPLIELLAVRHALASAQAATIDARLARVRAVVALADAEGRTAFGEEM